VAIAELIVERPQAPAQVWALPSQIPELDGLRGLAIMLVLICHSAMWLPESVLGSVLKAIATEEADYWRGRRFSVL